MKRLARHFLVIVLCAAVVVPASANEDDLRELRRRLASTDASTRQAAVVEAFDLGEGAAAVLNELVPLLDDVHSDIRLMALATVAVIGPKANGVAPNVAACLDDDVAGIRKAAAETIVAIGPSTIPSLRTVLRDGTDIARVNALETLVSFGEDSSAALPEVIQSMESDDPLVRRAAIASLSGMGKSAQAAVRQLLWLIRSDEYDDVRYSALLALGRIGPAAATAVPECIDILSDENAPLPMRIAAIWSLGQFGPKALSAESMLAELLRTDENPTLRGHAAQALGKMGARSRTTVDALNTGLHSMHSMLQTASIVAVLRLGTDASSTVPALGRLLVNGAVEVRVRTLAARALQAMGPNAAEAVPELAWVLNEEDPQLKIAAAEALAEIGTPAWKAVPFLQIAARDADSQVRSAASNTLRRLTTAE